MVNAILGSFSSFSRLKGSANDDWVDRVSHIYTCILLGLFAIVVSTGQLVGDPIHCWCPAQFTGAYVSYTKWICWISNTYYIPLQDTIPVEIGEREDQEISYYQWIPLILLFQALLFKLPNLLWRMLHGGSGVNLDKLSELAEKTQLGSPQERDKTISHIAYFIDRWLESNRVYHWNMVVRARQTLSRFCCFFCGKREGTYLTGLYLFVKLLYCANVIGQFFLLNSFLSIDYGLYGFEVIDYLTAHGQWKESPRFPRVTLCDFEIRQLQNLHRFTVQCVLPINLFNEKIFIFIWFWLVLVATVSCANFINWLYHIIFRHNRVTYVKKYLKLSDQPVSGSEKQLCRMFADQYLRDDGVFVLRVVGKNSTDLVLTDLVSHLWKLFKGKSSNPKNITDRPPNNEETETLS